MGKTFTAIDSELESWIARQKIFFVATAPLDANGPINCSPKGLDTLRVLGPKQVAYLDLPGSGIETVAHIRENGRIVLMLCAFDGPPRIVRLHGIGTVVEPAADRYAGLLAAFPEQAACRSVVVVEVGRISDSCGYGVPLYEHRGDRPSLPNWIRSKSADELAEYAEFFSFGTNDLTQTTFGISRDDSGRFLNAYIDKGIFERDPFVTLDDSRAPRALELLREVSADFQVIYLTTSTRYDALADKVVELAGPTATDPHVEAEEAAPA